ncbi:MAG TPA: lysophospholipid acyltransferase family protein, partial [Chthoniobacterales bacterium]
NDRSALKAVIRKIQEGNGVVLFPEGTRSPDGQLQPGQPGIGLIVAKTLAPVVPMRIFGAYEAFPKAAKGVKFRRITVVVGEPLHFTAEDVGAGTREDYRRLSQRIMESIGNLELP